MGPFLRIQSPLFPILPGEDTELVNEGMYGKALAEYLQGKLKQKNYDVPFFCCEDWGWWVEIAGYGFPFGVCIYGAEIAPGKLDLYVTDGATSAKKWSWRQFRFLDVMPAVEQLHKDLIAIFQADANIQLLATDLDSPFESTSGDGSFQ